MADNNTEPKSIQELENIVKSQQQKKQASPTGYIILSLLFPPAGLLSASRKQILHLVLPAFTAIYSLLFVLSIVISNYSLSGSLKSLQQAGMTSQEGSQMKLILLAGVILGMAGIFWGFYLRSKVKNQDFLSRKATYFLLLLNILQLLLTFYLYFYITSSLYNNLIF